MNWSWQLDGWIVLAGVLCAVSASLLGNFLLLRRMSMLGDAISHAVLPGLAAAFLLTGQRGSWVMFAGAVVTGVVTALATQWIRDKGQMDEGAAMGVIFTSLFAFGLVLNARAAGQVDLDTECVLYGNMEAIPFDQVRVLPGWILEGMGWQESAIARWRIPAVVLRLGILLVLNAVFVWGLFKELRISSFDPGLSTSMGIPAGWMHYLLMILVAVTAVASFESVGNILVVAMFVVPPAAASLITGRLSAMVLWSALLAALSAIIGHWLAVAGPAWFGSSSTNTAGMMAVVAGGLFGLAWLFGPRQGLFVRAWNRRKLQLRILREDLLAFLYRWQEKRPAEAPPVLADLSAALIATPAQIQRSLMGLQRNGLVREENGNLVLTAAGLAQATEVVRSHRLWEQYLVTEMNVPVDRIHDKAESLEHFTGGELRQRLEQQTSASATDPHGSPIPPEPGT